MEKRIENLRNLLDSLLVDLEYVVRISSLYGLIGCRAYIEKILNIILEENSIKIDQMHLFDKIEFLRKKGILKGRLLAEIETIRYRGNDATHELIGTESEAKSALSICKKLKKWFLNRNFSLELQEGKEYSGVIKSYGAKGYGFIKEDTTGKDIYFSLDQNDSLISKRVKKGRKIKFVVRYTKGDTPYKAINLKLIGFVKNFDQNNDYKFSFIDGEREDDIYFSFSSLDEQSQEKIKEGSELAFKLKKGSKNDEAYDIELI